MMTCESHKTSEHTVQSEIVIQGDPDDYALKKAQ